jgi:hypothetical protein
VIKDDVKTLITEIRGGVWKSEKFPVKVSRISAVSTGNPGKI